jgi:hypothetical protein
MARRPRGFWMTWESGMAYSGSCILKKILEWEFLFRSKPQLRKVVWLKIVFFLRLCTIPDPGSGAFLIPGSEKGFIRISDPGSRIPDPGSSPHILRP